MVAGHGKLGELIGNSEMRQLLLHREFIAESEAIIEKAETYRHLAFGRWLHKIHGHFVVVLTYFRFLAPHRLPCGIDRCCIDRFDLETLVEVTALFKFEAKAAWSYSRAVAELERILGCSIGSEAEIEGKLAIGRSQSLGTCRECHQEGGYGNGGRLHGMFY